MHLKELIHRSPMRAFERSVHGGLGRGNLGLTAGPAGVGKNAFITGLALDRLLHGERVLHVAGRQTVEHVRERYEEIFAELARSSNLEERRPAHERIESHRIIRSLRDGPLHTDHVTEAVELLQANADFRPDMLVVEGWNFEAPHSSDELPGLVDLARKLDAELWMPIRVPRLKPGEDWHDMPENLVPVAPVASVIVRLHAVGDIVRIRLLKDHDNTELADLDLDLDPTSLLVREG